MKINKFGIFAVVLAILVSAFVCVNVSAEGEAEGALTIKSINIAYKDQIELLVAVDVDYAEKDNVEVKYTIDGETKTATLHPTETCVKDGVTYPVFYAAGIAPKDIGKVMTFEAHIKDSGATGTPYAASILDYLYARLYKDDFISAEEGEDLAKKNLYNNTINYASSALEVLVNYQQGKNEVLYNDYVFIWSEDEGVKVDGNKLFSAVISGTEVTPTYNAAISEWTLLNADGTSQGEAAYGDAIAVTAHTKLAAGEVAPVVDSYTVMDYQSGASNDFVSSKDSDGAAVTGTWETNTSLSMGLTTDGENTFLHVRNQADSGKTGITTVNLSNTLQAGNCYTFETKVNVKGATAGYNFAQIKFVNNNGGEALNLFLGYATVDGKTGVAIKTTGDNSSVAKGTALFDATDKTLTTATGWFTLRIEFYFGGVGTENASNTYLKLYVDEVLAYDGQANWAMGASISHAQIDHISAGKTHNSCYDDIYFTRTDKAYAAGNEYAE